MLIHAPTPSTVNAGIRIEQFEPQLEAARPDTAELLRSAQLTVHPAVAFITLHGSRGLAGGNRPDSDVDLCLVVDAARLARAPDPAAFLETALQTTLDAWAGPVEADLAAAWDERGCGLECLNCTAPDPPMRVDPWRTLARPFASAASCSSRFPDAGQNCFGLYKIQKGFTGFVRDGVEVRRMLPCLVIWRNPQAAAEESEP